MSKSKASAAPVEFVIDETSGVKIPADLAGNIAPITDFSPNPWNPNRMDNFMRTKLGLGIKTDGFIIPVLVRPNPDTTPGTPRWQIIDGEHRWKTGAEDLKMTNIPFVNLGPITDAAAQQITIKANSLKGEFDSVELARIVENLVKEAGMDAVAAALPYSPERLKGMLDLLSTDIGSLLPNAPPGDDDESDEAKRERGKSDKSFQSFNPDEMKFEMECPRCHFGFNPSEKADLGKPKS